MKTLFMLTSGRPPMPMRGDVHPAVAAAVRRALSHAPDERFPTAAAMQETLEEAIKQADLGTTTAAVSAYLASEVGDRAEKRKAAIALGLSAAEARERYAHIMQSNTEKSSGGTSLTGAREVAEVLTARADRVASDETTVPDGISSASKSATGQTIGSASISIIARDGARGRRLAIVAATVGIAICVLAVAALRGPRNKPLEATTAPHAPVATAATAIVAATPAPETAIPSATPPGIPPPPPPETSPRSAPPQSPSLSALPTREATAPSKPAPRPSPAAATPPARQSSPPPPSTAVPRVNDGF